MKVFVGGSTPSVLRLTLANSPAAYVGWGLVFLAAGCWALWALAVSATVTADNGGLEYRRAVLGFVTTDALSTPGADITSVTVVLDDGLVSKSYEVAVMTAQGTAVLRFPSADGDAKRDLARRLAAAVRGDGPAVAHTDDTVQVFGLLLGGACIVGGLVCMLAFQRVRISADRDEGVLTVARLRGVTRTRTVARIAITAATAAKVRVTRPGGPGVAPVYQVIVTGAQGASVPLTHFGAFTEESAQFTARYINEWLADGFGRGVSGTGPRPR